MNPRAGLEAERTISKTAHPKNVMVAGGGVGGLEAAVTAAAIGHTVELYERKSDIGGQLGIAAIPPGKKDLLEILRYYRAMIRKYRISMHLETEVTRNLILDKKPDYIIIAEGAEPAVPPIEGVDEANVLTSWQVLEDNPPLGNEVGIIGGGAVGLETAMFVAARGTISAEVLKFLFTYDAESKERLHELLFRGTSHVTVLEMLPKMGGDMGKSSRWVMMENLKRCGVTLVTGARVAAIDGGRITYEKDGHLENRSFDQVILATGSRSVRHLSQEAADLVIPMTTIGDSNATGKIHNAIHGGFLAALNIS
jgi:2,4-dienoyl-CoA reductase (NADPH2)